MATWLEESREVVVWESPKLRVKTWTSRTGEKLTVWWVEVGLRRTWMMREDRLKEGGYFDRAEFQQALVWVLFWEWRALLVHQRSCNLVPAVFMGYF